MIPKYKILMIASTNGPIAFPKSSVRSADAKIEMLPLRKPKALKNVNAKRITPTNRVTKPASSVLSNLNV
jgi:hypothetical protein